MTRIQTGPELTPEVPGPATTELPDEVSTPRDAASASAQLEVDSAWLGEYLLGRWADARKHSRELLLDPSFTASTASPMDEHRERVLGQLHLLVEEGAVHRAFPKSPSAARTTTAATSPPSRSSCSPTRRCRSSRACSGACSAAAVLHLGTERHHDDVPARHHEPRGARRVRDDRDRSRLGCRLHRHDGDLRRGRPTSSSSTPRSAPPGRTTSATPPLHGRAAVVFAQLITEGVNHGVHAFYVPIRDDEGFLPGIGGEDDGLKGGLNGIDNGRLHFTGVRVPRTNLLNRYGDVDENGIYTSPIDEPRPPLLHHARHPRAGPRLARRRRRRREQGRAARSRSATRSQRRQFTGGRRATRRCCSTTSATSAACCRASRRPTRCRSRTRCSSTSSTGCSPGATTPTPTAQDLETIAAALKPLQHLGGARHPAGVPRGLRRRRLPRREPLHPAARRPRHLRHLRGRQQRAAAARRQAPAHRLLAQVREARMPAAIAGSSPARSARRPSTAPACARLAPERRRLRLDGALGRLRARRRRRSASCSPTACRRWSPSSPRAASAHRKLSRRRRRRALQPPPERAHRGGARARRAAAVGGVHASPRRHRPTRRHQAGAHLAARPVRPRAHREEPRLVPHPRPPLGAARARRSPTTSTTGCCRGCARTRSTSSTPSGSRRSTCARRSRRAPSRCGRTRRARTTRRSASRARLRSTRRRSRRRSASRRLPETGFGTASSLIGRWCPPRPPVRGCRWFRRCGW